MQRQRLNRGAFNEAARGMTDRWWIFLITGVAWLILGKIVFDADLGSVAAIATFAGFILIFAGVNEFAAAWLVSDWKWLHGTVGVLMIIAGVFAFIRPDITFLSLAAILGWYLLFKGILDIVVALADRDFDLWWVGLLVGVFELMIGLWAAGYPGRSTTLLIVWVGISAVTRGVMEIILAFRLRSLRDEIPAAPATAA